MPGSVTREHALDHVIVVLFENRSLDNLLGTLYVPEDGKTFEGVVGKDLSNPIPSWAEHGADRKVVPYTVATDMDSPNPDSGEEWYHTNTQLYNVLDEHNRFQIGEGVTAPPRHAPSITCLHARRRAIPTRGSPSKPRPFRTGHSTMRSSARPSATSAKPPAPA
jgi:phospholipase C